MGAELVQSAQVALGAPTSTSPTVEHQLTRVVVLVIGVGLLVAAFGGAAFAQGADLGQMLEACRQFMASLGVSVSPEAMRSMMAGCMAGAGR